MERLHEAYRRMALVLSKRRKVRTLELDAEGDLDQAIERVAGDCATLIGDSHPAQAEDLPDPT
jgi:hypothetical protein